MHTSWYSANVPELVFFQLVTGEVQAVELDSGLTKWITRPLPKLIKHPAFLARNFEAVSAGVNLTDDRMYIISGDYLFCFDAIYGQLIWRHHLAQSGQNGFQPSSGPMAVGFRDSLRVFVGDWEGRVRSYLQRGSSAPIRPVAVESAFRANCGCWSKDNEVYVVDHSGRSARSRSIVSSTGNTRRMRR